MDGASGRGHVISEKGDVVDSVDEMRKKRLAYFGSAQKTAEKQPQVKQDSQKVVKNSLRPSDPVEGGVPRRLNKTSEVSSAQSLEQNTRFHNVGNDLNLGYAVAHSVGISRSENVSLTTNSVTVNEKTSAVHSVSNFAHSLDQPNRDWKNHVENLCQAVHGMDPELRDSHDVEALSVFKSEADLDSLGLSTHRPESAIVDGHDDAPLDRDITQEIKHLLGAKKYQEFVDKSIKDINELYQHKTTETSPHLINSLIEERRQESGNIEMARSNQPLREKTPSQDIRKLENDVPLNNSFAKTSTQRLRLNRPRKEPVHIQNIVTKNLKELESAASVSSSVRNYDQVTIPHNVTYSTDEIYRQAFAMAHSQVPPPGYQGVDVGGGMNSPEVRSMVSSSQLFQPNIGSPPSVGMPFSYPGQVASNPNQIPLPTPPPHSLFYPPYQHPDYNQTVVNPATYGYQMSDYGGGYSRTPFTTGGNYPMPVFYPGAIDFTQPPPGWGVFNPPQMNRVPHPPAEKKPSGEVNKMPGRSGAWSSQGKIVNDGVGLEEGDDLIHQSNACPEKLPTQQAEVLADVEEHMMQPSQRHVEKIRQHHEQRRQKHEDKIHEALHLGKQKQFASASLDRYFSSLENIHRTVDFEEDPVADDDISLADGLQYDADTDTCFTSVSGITGTSVQAGGVTERLKNLGIDTKPVAGSETGAETPDGKPKRKLVKVCPECASWNKEYMSWCADCGELLIGVEVIDAKQKKKKEREHRRQQNRLHLAKKNSPDERKRLETDHRGFAAHKEIEQQPMEKNETNVNSVLETEPAKPALNLNTDDAEKSHSAVENKHNLMPFLRTEKDINDICEAITDPAIKGFLKSYFRKKSQAAQDVISADEHSARESSGPILRNDQNELGLSLHSSVAWEEVKDKTEQNALNEQDEIEVEIFAREESQPFHNPNRHANVVPILNLARSSDEDEDKKKPFKPLSFSIDSDDWSSVLDRQDGEPQSQDPVLKPYNITQSGDAARPRNAFLSYLLESKSQARKTSQTRPKSADMLERKRRLAQNRAQECLGSSNYPRQHEKPSFSQGALRSGQRRDGVRMSISTDNIDDGNSRASLPLKKTRPASADLYRRKSQFPSQSSSYVRPPTMPPGSQYVVPPKPADVAEDVASPRGTGNVPNIVTHRLQPDESPPIPPIICHGPTSSVVAYSKYRELTPRIREGAASMWLCLPDELWLHVFSFLAHSDLVQCAKVCKQLYRISLDESLWQYITVRKKFTISDEWLMQIAGRHPVSLALIQCHGENITAKGLRDLFRETASNLKELNFSRCSKGGLTGDSILLHASARCRNLTHVDASWCNATDNGISAISECAHRLESLCINGCQMLSDEGLETLLKKHGKSLRVLEMFGCFNVTPNGIRSLASHCSNLLTLNLGQCYKLTDLSITHLSASLGRVENLDLRGCKQIRDDCIRKVVRNCPRLKILTLANCPNITDAAMIEIATYLTDIRSIDICGCRNVTDHSIKTLTHNCQRLNELDISSTGCTHRSVLLIANYCNRNLETLKLNFLADVTEASLQKLLKHCKKLKILHLYGCTSVRNTIKLQQLCPFLSVEM
ncbi:uncharacterized protein LOC121381927 [Gigantopelta aegis]|uniref:uncharacterized protein LOC121381927 n=1 Tax=Gigantopelta aegis TaxID=1735272 RepID=UPI001B888953|nr:uncharacterized protein LOC121381927 [Gigantopelta aegis]